MKFGVWRNELAGRWSSLNRRARAMFVLKVLTLAVFIVTTNGGLGLGKRSVAGHVALVGVWLFSLIAIVQVAFFASRRTRAIWSVLLVASAVVGVSYKTIFNEPLMLVDLEQLLSVLGFVDTVARFYGRMLALPLALCALGLVAINLPHLAAAASSPKPIRRRLRDLGVQVAPIIAMVIMLFFKNGKGTNGLATQHTTLAFLVTLAIERVAAGTPPVRETEIKLQPATTRPFKNIIVLISNHDRIAQFSVFPSLLQWMGYAREDIKKLDVDPPIDEPIANGDGQKFLSVFYVRLGASPVWTSINKRF